MQLLETQFTVRWVNIVQEAANVEAELKSGQINADVIFAKGCWWSKPDLFMHTHVLGKHRIPTALFPACSSQPTNNAHAAAYDVIFYDKHWLAPMFHFMESRIMHAFGIDTRLYNQNNGTWAATPKVFDYTTVGMFAPWKRQELILGLEGRRLVVGYMYDQEFSSKLMSDLMSEGVAIWADAGASALASAYRASAQLFMPALDVGGGERVLFEARACGIPVENIILQPDNDKLVEFLVSPITDHIYYGHQLAKGLSLALQRPVPVLPHVVPSWTTPCVDAMECMAVGEALFVRGVTEQALSYITRATQLAPHFHTRLCQFTRLAGKWARARQCESSPPPPPPPPAPSPSPDAPYVAVKAQRSTSKFQPKWEL